MQDKLLRSFPRKATTKVFLYNRSRVLISSLKEDLFYYGRPKVEKSFQRTSSIEELFFCGKYFAKEKFSDDFF